MLLHTMQELDDHFRAGPNEHLTLARFFSIVDGIQRVIKDTCLDHGGEDEILNSMAGGEVSGGAKRSILASERRVPCIKGFCSPCRRRSPIRRVPSA